jgi:hypothetical protein
MNKKLFAYGSAAAGAGLILAGLTGMRKRKVVKPKKHNIPDYLTSLIPIAGQEVVGLISFDPQWAELCDRASEFYVLAKEEFKNLLFAVAGVVAFQLSIQVNQTKPSLGTPRMFRTKLHAVVEAVREMRATVEEKCSSALDDFDEVAADIQRSHDDAAYNMQLECSQ